MSLIRQHLIDPVSCIRCDGCRLMCPTKAISKIDGTLVIDFELCDGNGACSAACDTGAINSWRTVTADGIYSKAEQAGWENLPPQTGLDYAMHQVPREAAIVRASAPQTALPPQTGKFRDSAPALARVVANTPLTDGTSSDVHHLVFDLTGTGMIVAEGQSVGVVPPGTDDAGAAHAARLYSVASPREGEGGCAGHVAFTVKRVIEDEAGQPHHGVCSNHVCDLQPGETVRLTGPFGATFLLPEDPAARLLMICTGTGIAPMRGMIEHRLRCGLATSDSAMLFYGGRTQAELPYLDDLQALAGSGDIHLSLALSREPALPRTYVQDALAASADRLGPFLQDPNACIYICGLVAMEEGVMDALALICERTGLDCAAMLDTMRTEGRFHVETY